MLHRTIPPQSLSAPALSADTSLIFLALPSAKAQRPDKHPPEHALTVSGHTLQTLASTLVVHANNRALWRLGLLICSLVRVVRVLLHCRLRMVLSLLTSLSCLV